jgi:predicted DNA-binding transcriptional regulator YafY
MEVLIEGVAPRARQPLEGTPEYLPSPEDETIVIDLARPAWWLVDELVVDDVQQEGAWRTVTLRAPAFEWLARKLVGIGDTARVRRPDALAERVGELASQLRRHYRDDPA